MGRFAHRVIELLAAREAVPAGLEVHLQTQVAFAVAENSWVRRAERWKYLAVPDGLTCSDAAYM